MDTQARPLGLGLSHDIHPIELHEALVSVLLELRLEIRRGERRRGAHQQELHRGRVSPLPGRERLPQLALAGDERLQPGPALPVGFQLRLPRRPAIEHGAGKERDRQGAAR